LAYADWAIMEAERRGISLGRFGRAEEVSPMVMLLLSPLSSYITGSSIDVAGGAESQGLVEAVVGDKYLEKYKKIYIEITNVCNLSCDFCPRTMREPEFMTTETFGRILDQIKPYTRYIYLHVKGEPLLHPELDKFLDLSQEKGFRVNITTNGTLIHSVQDMLLSKPALRQINFSLHSFDSNEAGQDKEDYIADILNFTREAMKKSEIFVSLRLWNLTENRSTDLADRRNDELLASIEKEFDLPFRIQEEVIPDRGIKIADKIYINQAHLFIWPDLKEKEDDGRGFCYGLRSQAAILVDGSVIPCCLDGEGVMNLGNIHMKAFSEIISSHRARDIVDGFSRKEAVEELCRKCGYRQRFSSQISDSTHM